MMGLDLGKLSIYTKILVNATSTELEAVLSLVVVA